MGGVSEFLAMGGYAPYVWPAYAVALIVIGGIGVASVRNLRALRRQVEAMEAASPRRARRARRLAEGATESDA